MPPVLIPAWSAAIAAIAFGLASAVSQSPRRGRARLGRCRAGGRWRVHRGAEWEARRPARLTLRFSRAARPGVERFIRTRRRAHLLTPDGSTAPFVLAETRFLCGPPVRDVSGGQPADLPTGRAQRGSVRLAGDPAKARRRASS